MRLVFYFIAIIAFSSSFSDAQIDDENPDQGNFCVLDEFGNPINCNANDELHDDGFVRSTMNCTDTAKGPLLTSCLFTNICYDGRSGAYLTVKEHEPTLKENEVKHYDGARDWLFFADDATLQVPRADLIAHDSQNEFTANVTKPSVRADQVEWIEGTSVLIYRQYLVNYYHIIMDDMIGIWWTMQHHIPNLQRNFNFVFLDDHVDTSIDTKIMMRAMTTEPLLFRKELHARNKLICFRRALVGQAERSWGGPGRRFITNSMLKAYQTFLRDGAYALIDSEALDDADLSLPPPIVISRPRAAVLFRVGTRVILNEPEVMQGLRDAFPNVDFFEMRTEKMSFQEQILLMRNSTLLISVHGAGLTNLLFMPPKSAVVEILPWHWERHAYGRICEILDYGYVAWRNLDKNATRFHESTFDGFPMVSESDRAIIRNADSKPMDMRSPGALAAEKYWINQDTYLNVPEFVESVRKALNIKGGLNAKLSRGEIYKTEL